MPATKEKTKAHEGTTVVVEAEPPEIRSQPGDWERGISLETRNE